MVQPIFCRATHVGPLLRSKWKNILTQRERIKQKYSIDRAAMVDERGLDRSPGVKQTYHVYIQSRRAHRCSRVKRIAVHLVTNEIAATLLGCSLVSFID